MAEFAERVLSIEEERIQDQLRIPPAAALTPNDNFLPAAWERIHGLGIVMNDSAGRFDARVTRYSYDAVTGRQIRSVLDYPI